MHPVLSDKLHDWVCSKVPDDVYTFALIVITSEETLPSVESIVRIVNEKSVQTVET